MKKQILTLLTLLSCVALSAQMVDVCVCQTDKFLAGCTVYDRTDGDQTGIPVDIGEKSYTLNLHWGQPTIFTYTDTITIGETYLFGCEAITPTAVGDTTLVDSLITLAGCDSIVTLNLHIKDSCHTARMSYCDTITIGKTYLFGCEAITPTAIGDSTLVDSLITPAGCDSIVTLKLHVLPVEPLDTTIYDTICYATDYVHRLGTLTNLTKDTTFTDTVPNAVQLNSRYYLDSLYTYKVKVNPAYYGITDGATICQGTEHLWADTTWAANSAAGTYVVTRTLTTVTDCDSVVTYTLKINPAYYGITDGATICQRTEHSWADTTWEVNSAAGTYVVTRTLTTVTDCDSVVTYTLTIHDSIETHTENIVLCTGDAIEWHDQMVDGSQPQYTDILSTQDGICDSIIYVLNVDVHSLYLDNLPAFAKDKNWLLMIDRRAIRDTFGLNPTEEQVAWYRVQGEQDQLPDGETDDTKVGTGYYYTDDKALSGDYYAVINVDLTHIDKCLQVARTIVLHCNNATSAPRLTPTLVGTDQPMILSNLDSQSATTITIYDAAGAMVRQLSSKGADTYTLSAESVSGMYLMLIKNETQTCTIKFTVINQ